MAFQAGTTTIPGSTATPTLIYANNTQGWMTFTAILPGTIALSISHSGSTTYGSTVSCTMTGGTVVVNSLVPGDAVYAVSNTNSSTTIGWFTG